MGGVFYTSQISFPVILCLRNELSSCTFYDFFILAWNECTSILGRKGTVWCFLVK